MNIIEKYWLYLAAWVAFWFLVWRILAYIFNKFER